VRYDLNLIHQLCGEIGLSGRIDGDQAQIDLGQGAVLCFLNAERDEDCRIEFLGTPWHVHDDLMFADGRGNYVELDYLNLVTGLKDGQVLVCERLQRGRVADRSLVHRDYNDELKYMEEGEQIIIRRVSTNSVGDRLFKNP
jgi:hypothetical protein